MAGPINGLGAQQQIPLSQPFQPGQQNNNQQVRQDAEQVPQTNQIQPEGAPASEVQNANADNQDPLQAQQESALFANSNEESALDPEQPRGSVIDITV